MFVGHELYALIIFHKILVQLNSIHSEFGEFRGIHVWSCICNTIEVYAK